MLATSGICFRIVDKVLVDTASANTWIGASKPYLPTGTSQDTGETFVSVRFQSLICGDGLTAEGEEYLDTILI